MQPKELILIVMLIIAVLAMVAVSHYMQTGAPVKVFTYNYEL